MPLDPEQSGRAHNTLDLISVILVVLVCAVFIVRTRVLVDHEQFPKGNTTAVYELGSHVTDTPELGFNKADRTLILVTASWCHFCKASMGFYAQLTSRARRAGIRIVVAAAAEEPDINAQYLRLHSVQFDASCSGQTNGITVRGTPRLLLVSKNGRVLGTWAGQLSKDAEAEVMDVISNTSLSKQHI